MVFQSYPPAPSRVPKTTLATTPSPSRIRIAVPTNSANSCPERVFLRIQAPQSHEDIYPKQDAPKARRGVVPPGTEVGAGLLLLPSQDACAATQKGLSCPTRAASIGSA